MALSADKFESIPDPDLESRLDAKIDAGPGHYLDMVEAIRLEMSTLSRVLAPPTT